MRPIQEATRPPDGEASNGSFPGLGPVPVGEAPVPIFIDGAEFHPRRPRLCRRWRDPAGCARAADGPRSLCQPRQAPPPPLPA